MPSPLAGFSAGGGETNGPVGRPAGVHPRALDNPFVARVEDGGQVGVGDNRRWERSAPAGDDSAVFAHQRPIVVEGQGDAPTANCEITSSGYGKFRVTGE